MLVANLHTADTCGMRDGGRAGVQSRSRAHPAPKAGTMGAVHGRAAAHLGVGGGHSNGNSRAAVDDGRHREQRLLHGTTEGPTEECRIWEAGKCFTVPPCAREQGLRLVPSGQQPSDAGGMAASSQNLLSEHAGPLHSGSPLGCARAEPKCVPAA